MIKKILLILFALTLTSRANVKERIPKLQKCTGNETNKTLAEVLCKK